MSTMVAMKTLNCWYPRELYSMTLYVLLDMEGYIVVTRYVNVIDCLKILSCLYFQALLAQQYGCRGLIIYSDPADYAPEDGPLPFPDGWSLPDTGIQRGTLNSISGDVLTPDLPAIGSDIEYCLILCIRNSC